MKSLIVINNEVLEVIDSWDNVIELDNGEEYVIFEDSMEAGKKAREYWKDMAENDKQEFICMVGEETLVSWCLGGYAGPGTEKVCSLEEWFDLWEDTPATQWASYDGEEIEGAKFNNNFAYEFGIDDRNSIVLYRCN